MEKSTRELEHELQKADSLQDFTRKNAPELVVPDAREYLLKLVAERGISKPELVRESLLERTYGAHLLATGSKRHLTREKLLLFALAGKLTLDETQQLLKYGREGALYVRDKRDQALIYAFKEQMDVAGTQELLTQLGLKQLSTSPDTRD